MQPKRILVTGGGGFIGSVLCEKLLLLGHEVLALDNFRTSQKRNVGDLISNPRFKLITGDTRETTVDKLPFEGPIEQVYDLASPASVTYIMDHPIEVATVNAIGTKNMLDIALKHKSTFLFASTSEAYGDPKEHPQKESYWGNVNPVGVRSGYDEGKRFGETLTMAYRREHKLNVKIVRIFNTYGPKSDPSDSRVIPSFVTRALRGEPLPVHGDGSQTRSFCFVTDMVDGIIAMMESSETGPINLGNPDEYKVIDMAKKILQMTGSKSQITFVDRPEDDPSRRKPDISFAKQKLDWEPKVGLDEGLKKTITYFNKLLQSTP